MAEQEQVVVEYAGGKKKTNSSDPSLSLPLHCPINAPSEPRQKTVM